MMCLLIGFGQVRADSRRFKVAEWVQNGNFAPGGPSTPFYGPPNGENGGIRDRARLKKAIIHAPGSRQANGSFVELPGKLSLSRCKFPL